MMIIEYSQIMQGLEKLIKFGFGSHNNRLFKVFM